MKTKKYLALVALVAVCPLRAQDIGGILESVERNNKELQALQKANEAALLEAKSGNALEDLSLEYSPFYQKGVSGMASSELVITQGFDFPTLYSSRRKAGQLQEEALGLEYRLARRDILLQAELLCFDLIHLGRAKALLDKRCTNAEKLLALFEKRLAAGGATLIEVNKIKMDRMNIETEKVQNGIARQTALQALGVLNGDVPFTFEAADYPSLPQLEDSAALVSRMVATDYGLLAARANALVAGQNVKVEQQSWIPKFEVGYRRNTETGEASHGFLVGGTIPLFSSRHRQKMARAQQAGAHLQEENARIQAENQARGLLRQLYQLKQALDVYDVDLLDNTLEILRKAVENGELSLIDYYVEADAIYANLQAYLSLERQYQGTLAEIFKGEL